MMMREVYEPRQAASSGRLPSKPDSCSSELIICDCCLTFVLYLKGFETLIRPCRLIFVVQISTNVAELMIIHFDKIPQSQLQSSQKLPEGQPTQ